MDLNDLSNVSDFFSRNTSPPPRRQRQALSTWGEAIVAAATGDAARMRELLSGVSDDGSGINLRTFRTSYADVTFILAERNIVIDPNYTLVEVAVERDFFDVVIALTEQPKQPANEAHVPPAPLARSVSTFVPRSLADNVRDHLAAHLEVATDGAAAGLALLMLPEAAGRKTFVLPKEIVELPLEQRRLAIGLLLEDAYSMESIDATTRRWNLAVGTALGVPSESPELALPVRDTQPAPAARSTTG